MGCFNDAPGGFVLPGFTFNTAAMSSSTASAGWLTGTTPVLILNNSGATPGTLTTRTAAQMLADTALVVGQTWLVLLVNGQATGTLTLGGGSNVTISGTATVAANTARLYMGQVTSPTTISFTNLGWSFTATALAFGA